jgi:replication factor A1
VNYQFVKIANISNLDNNANIDILCIVKHIGEMSEIISQKMGGKTLIKREITVCDDSGYEIRLTLWNNQAQSVDWGEDVILAVKGVSVGEYGGGKTLSTRQSSSITVNPDIPEGHALFEWKSNNKTTHTQSISAQSSSMFLIYSNNILCYNITMYLLISMNMCTIYYTVLYYNITGSTFGGIAPMDQRLAISAIKDRGLGMGDKPDYVTVKGCVTYIRHDTDPWYTACPTEGCNKKVISNII